MAVAEPFDRIEPGREQQDLLVARRMGSASWLTVPRPAPPLPAFLRVEEEQEIAPHQATVPCGLYVDFTGHEDLLEEFTREAEKAGLNPSESILDLVHLFVSGDLCLRTEML